MHINAVLLDVIPWGETSEHFDIAAIAGPDIHIGDMDGL
jgi:hypothetical protein